MGPFHWKAMAAVIGILGVTILPGCSLFHWSGYFYQSEAYPQLYYDWSKTPYFPSPGNTEPRFKLKFPKTAKEHRAAAKRFFEKAKEYRVEAAVHKQMKASYEKIDPAMVKHCDRLIKRYDDLADDMEQFARWHQQEAEKLDHSKKPPPRNRPSP